MLNDYLITLDVDWASDKLIKKTSNFLIKNKIKTTWFITHDSKETRKLFKYPGLFEIGLHPNFDYGSTQGDNLQEIMGYLVNMSPYSKSIRTHGLFQSFNILKSFREEYGIFYDVSLLLPLTKNIIPHRLYFSKELYLIRLPYFWEDDIEMYFPNPSFKLSSTRYHLPGLKIFNFHPIHIALNSINMENYLECKSKVEISSCSLNELEEYINYNINGTGTFFKELISFIKNKSSESNLTISEFAKRWDNNEYNGNR